MYIYVCCYLSEYICIFEYVYVCMYVSVYFICMWKYECEFLYERFNVSM